MDEITIEKVDNGYILKIYTPGKGIPAKYIYPEYSEVINHLNGLEDEPVKEDAQEVNLYNTGYEMLPVTESFSNSVNRRSNLPIGKIESDEDKLIKRVGKSIENLAADCWEAGLSIDQVIKLK